MKHTMFELFVLLSLELFALFSCISKETVLSDAASIVFFFHQFVRFLFEGGFYSRVAST